MSEKARRVMDELQKPKNMDIILAIAKEERKYTEIYNYLVVVDRLLTMTTLKHRLDGLKETGIIYTEIYDVDRGYVKYKLTPFGSFVAEQLNTLYKDVEEKLKKP